MRGWVCAHQEEVLPGATIDAGPAPGGSVAVEFDEIRVKTIRITIPSDKPVCISEIYVLGK